jgi:hypothetical protein
MILNDRADQILRIADMLGGAIVYETAYAAFPDVQEDILRRTITKLVKRLALAWLWDGGLRCKVFLTTAGDEGHEAGVWRWIKNPVAARRALETGYAGRALKLPSRFIHHQIAGMIALGVGGGIAELEPELWQQRERDEQVADAYAWPERDRRIVIENERMKGQSPHRWMRKGGLVSKINKSLIPDNPHPDWIDEYLVICPRTTNKLHPDLEQELAELVAARAAKNPKIRDGAGWWFVPDDDTQGDPRWHGIGENSVPPRPLPGIRSRRLSFAAEHEKRAALDRDRKRAVALLSPEEREARKGKSKQREAAAPPENSREIQRENGEAGRGCAAKSTPYRGPQP